MTFAYNTTAYGVYGVCCRNGSCNGCPPYISASCWRNRPCTGLGAGCCGGNVVSARGGIGGSAWGNCGQCSPWNPPSYASSCYNW